MDELAGQLGVVTGGGGAVGRVATQALLELGAEVVVCGRDPERLARAAEDAPGRVHPYPIDVTDEASWEELRAEVERLHRRSPTALVTAAGTTRREPFLTSSRRSWEEMWETNVVGTMLAARALIPGMVERGTGRVIAISSAAGRLGLGDRSGYAATKGAVEAFVRSLAVELGDSGVTVNCLAPGAMLTELNREWFAANPEIREEVERQVPQARLGDPAELAGAFRFLLTSSYSQGSVVAVDGGWTAA